MLTQDTDPPVLALDGVTRTFGRVVAVGDVSLHVRAGEVLGLVGENGAGKSTLMKMLGGVIAPTSGRILVDGVAHDRLTIPQSMSLGIALVHQELNLFDNLTVAANVLIGREPLRGGPLRLLDGAAAERRAGAILARLGAGFAASDRVAALSIAERQIVEIAKALSLDARVLILDEPTSSLTEAETERLVRIVADLRGQGVAIILISHRLTEIQRMADRVVVLRDGRTVSEWRGADIRPDRLIRDMIGRDLASVYRPPRAAPGDEVLGLRALRTTFRPDCPIDLSVRAGEIVGLAGLIGSGRTELAQTIFGLTQAVGGEIRLLGRPVRIRSAGQAAARGIALVPEDRKRSGIVLGLPVRANLTLASLGDYARAGLLNPACERAAAANLHRSLDIRPADTGLAIDHLSGGNQQKVALAKWLPRNPRVLILDEPTRGVDVGAKAEIYRLMRALTDDGLAVLMISSDMEEVIGVSDRVAVMHEGRIAGDLGRDALSAEAIMSLAVGR